MQNENLSSEVQWVAYPFRLISDTGLPPPNIPKDHYCFHLAKIMAMTHNSVLRSLNAVYHTAPCLSAGDSQIDSFLFYILVICEFLHDHHSTEEEVLFPEIEAASGIRGIMDENLEQHKVLESGLERLRKYATETQRADFSANELGKILDELKQSLEKHLHEEIQSLLALGEKIESKKLKSAYQRMHKEVEKRAAVSRAGPYVCGSQDNSFLLDRQKVRFPEVPSIAIFIVNWVLAWKHVVVWKFNPSDIYGNVRSPPKKRIGRQSQKPAVPILKVRNDDLGSKATHKFGIEIGILLILILVTAGAVQRVFDMPTLV